MDLLGNVFRELLKQARDESAKHAVRLAKELRKEGMNSSQIEEMLCASGFESDIIEEALREVAPKKDK